MQKDTKLGLVRTDERADGLVPCWPSAEAGLVGLVPSWA